MTTTYKVCPICEARNHRNAALCATCGTSIAVVAARQDSGQDDHGAELYDYRYGETDLAESSVLFKGRGASLVLLLLIPIIIGVIGLYALTPRLREVAAGVAAPTLNDRPTRLSGPTVTPGTPTATFTASQPPTDVPTSTPTRAPCVRKVAEGDSLIAIVSRCGHGSLAILPTVMALNGITDETRVQIGQEIIVPYPSATPDPAATSAPTEVESAANTQDQLERLAFDPFAPTLTPTLLPGLMWHIVRPDEDMIYIVAIYDTDLKILADLNPEISFPLCDFSEVYGGPECTVQLSIGQHVRVPAPTPTSTPPSAAGVTTPTARPTATFNAPIAQSPANEAYFSPLDQVTLRWVGTGRLDADEVYRIDFTNLDSGQRFQAETRELFLIVPSDWQSRDAESHRYSWQVSVFNTKSDHSTYQSETRSLVWQGSGQADS